MDVIFERSLFPVDPVHLSHPTGRDEYLFNEVGKLYGGSHNSIKGRPWIFGQFRDSILPAVCHVMDKERETLRNYRVTYVVEGRKKPPVNLVLTVLAPGGPLL